MQMPLSQLVATRQPDEGMKETIPPVPQEILDNSLLIVAHPDDEVLWFSSVLPRVQQTIVCFRPLSECPDAARRIAEDFPVDQVSFLGLETFGAYHPRNVRFPIRTRHGLLIGNSLPGLLRYRRNYRRLRQELSAAIPAGSHVFTHNPWGEYGHEEHVQVWQVLKSLQQSHRLTLWHSNYASTKSAGLMGQTLAASEVEIYAETVDTEAMQAYRRFYQERQAWTWFDDWQWFERELYFRLLPERPLASGSHVLSVNLCNVRY